MNGKEKMLVSPVDGKVIDISGLNKWQLRDIHYQEEIKMAKKILELPPFSEERKRLLNEGYCFVETLKLYYEKQDENYSWGASPFSVKLVRDVVKKHIQDTKREVVIYEAGVGLGVTIRAIMKIPCIKYYGCDVNLFKETAELCNQYDNLFLREATVYEDIIKMEDDSIDIFYADNVIEHLIPDEADEILNVLYRKMRKKGILIMLIPNWKDGPHDVTKYYLPKGTRATGFHFMEMSHFETLKLFGKHGFRSNYIVRDDIVKKDPLYMKNIGKLLTEALVSKVKNEVARTELLKWDYYQVYVLSK